MIEIGETVQLEVTWKNWSGNAYDPSEVFISLWDQDGTAKITAGKYGVDTNFEKSAVGIYQYYYTVPDNATVDVVSQWRYEFKAIDSDSRVSKDHGYFTIVDRGIQTTYATIKDVEILLQKDITDSTKPSMQEVTRLIRGKEDYIDDFCYQSWRERTVTAEYKYQRENPIGRWFLYYPLKYLPVREITALEFRSWGETWIDYFDHTTLWDLDGDTLRIYRFLTAWMRWKSIRVSYTYGHTVVPRDIRELCSKLVVLDILKGERYASALPGGIDGVLSMSELYKQYNDDCNRLLDRYKRILLK